MSRANVVPEVFHVVQAFAKHSNISKKHAFIKQCAISRKNKLFLAFFLGDVLETPTILKLRNYVRKGVSPHPQPISNRGCKEIRKNAFQEFPPTFSFRFLVLFLYFCYSYTHIIFYKHQFKRRPSPEISWLDGRCLKLVLRFNKKQGWC